MSTERRRHPRVVVNRELFEDSSAELAHAENLSFRGVFLRQEEVTVDSLKVGDEVRVRFSVVADDMVTIEARGRVVRCSRKPMGVGVEFLALSPIMRAELRRVIRFQTVRDRWEAGEEVTRGEWEAARSSQVPAGLSNAEFSSSGGASIADAKSSRPSPTRRPGPPPLPPRLRKSLGIDAPGTADSNAQSRRESGRGEEVDEEAVTRVFYHAPADSEPSSAEAGATES